MFRPSNCSSSGGYFCKSSLQYFTMHLMRSLVADTIRMILTDILTSCQLTTGEKFQHFMDFPTDLWQMMTLRALRFKWVSLIEFCVLLSQYEDTIQCDRSVKFAKILSQYFTQGLQDARRTVFGSDSEEIHWLQHQKRQHGTGVLINPQPDQEENKLQ